MLTENERLNTELADHFPGGLSELEYLAQVQNRDTLTMTVTATLAGAISMLANFGLFFGAFGGGNRNNALGIVVFSYDGRLCWGLNADFDLLPDLDRFRIALDRAFGVDEEDR